MSRRPQRAGGRRGQGGYTLIELLVGIILMGIFAAALYGFMFSGMSAARTQESQSLTQSQARTALSTMAGDVRQASSPAPGAVKSIDSYSSTGFIVYVDNRRTVDASLAIATRPQRVRYRIADGKLLREVAQPVGTTAPFTYGGYGVPVVLADNVSMGSTALFSATTSTGAALPASAATGAVGEVGIVTLRLRIQYRNGNTTPIAEYSTNVAPRNPLF